MSKNWLLNVALLACIGASSNSMLAGDDKNMNIKEAMNNFIDLSLFKKSVIGGVAVPTVFMAASFFSLLHNQPKVRFESQGQWKGLVNPKLLVANPKEYLKNASNVYWYLWIGQCFKDGHMEAKSDGTIKQTQKKLPHGVMGHLHTKLFVLKKTCGVFGDLGSVVTATLSGLFIAEKLGFIKINNQIDQTSSKDAPPYDNHLLEDVIKTNQETTNAMNNLANAIAAQNVIV